MPWRRRKIVVVAVAIAAGAFGFGNTACHFAMPAATGDRARLYQNGQAVADVVGPVEEKGDRIVFRKLANAEHFSTGPTIHYDGRKLRVIDVGSISSRDYARSADRWEVHENVLGDVVCEVVGE
jgi:hypothetical protein